MLPEMWGEILLTLQDEILNSDKHKKIVKQEIALVENKWSTTLGSQATVCVVFPLPLPLQVLLKLATIRKLTQG